MEQSEFETIRWSSERARRKPSKQIRSCDNRRAVFMCAHYRSLSLSLSLHECKCFCVCVCVIMWVSDNIMHYGLELENCEVYRAEAGSS